MEEQLQCGEALPKLGIWVTFRIFRYYFMQMLDSILKYKYICFSVHIYILLAIPPATFILLVKLMLQEYTLFSPVALDIFCLDLSQDLCT